ncbi:hypothetical protein RclHR1_00020002 [Rhizophagus clarus]|uniref:Ricin B lectin domain-containing protein n=1 Tax=Rhizophagus clarus TaxID=94130 RepID=A0A2Z6R2Q8_9GLOM|nr:hypothetical protein RclHR1_00020002 [Rhizophagus clarus]
MKFNILMLLCNVNWTIDPYDNGSSFILSETGKSVKFNGLGEQLTIVDRNNEDPTQRWIITKQFLEFPVFICSSQNPNACATPVEGIFEEGKVIAFLGSPQGPTLRQEWVIHKVA